MDGFFIAPLIKLKTLSEIFFYGVDTRCREIRVL